MDKKSGLLKNDLNSEALQPSLKENQAHIFSVLYEKYIDQVYRYLLARLGNVHEAEDLTSQTFLKALQAYPHLRDNSRFAPWIFRIARNLSNDYYRRDPNREASLQEGLSTNNPDLLSDIVSDERAIHLQKVITGLSMEDQELLRLRFVGQLTLREVAEVFRQNESTLKKKYYMLLSVLKEKLEEE